MATSVRSGTSEICMAMDPLEWRDCVPASSGENPSLAAPTRMVLSQWTTMISKVPTEQSP